MNILKDYIPASERTGKQIQLNKTTDLAAAEGLINEMEAQMIEEQNKKLPMLVAPQGS